MVKNFAPKNLRAGSTSYLPLEFIVDGRAQNGDFPLLATIITSQLAHLQLPLPVAI